MVQSENDSNQSLPVENVSNQSLPAENVSNPSLPVENIYNPSLPAENVSNQSLPGDNMSQGAEQLTKIIQNPMIKGYLGKSIKLIAGFAILGCVLLMFAITALSALITNALPK